MIKTFQVVVTINFNWLIIIIIIMLFKSTQLPSLKRRALSPATATIYIFIKIRFQSSQFHGLSLCSSFSLSFKGTTLFFSFLLSLLLGIMCVMAFAAFYFIRDRLLGWSCKFIWVKRLLGVSSRLLVKFGRRN